MPYEDVDENDRSAMPPHVAAAAAAVANRANKELFSDEEVSRAEDLRDRVVAAFPDRRVFLNYRKNVSTIKVEGVSIRDRVSMAVKDLDAWCETENVEVRTSKAGTSKHYRFKRSK